MTGAEFVKLQPLLSGREGPVSLRTIADSLNLGQEGMRRGALRGSGTDLTDGPADRVADRQCAVVVGVAGLLTLRRQRLPTRDP